jgi:glycosyltransferase involved in cell wall biosynthesis
MSFGLPVVATDWRAIGSIVRDDESGFLVSIGDSPAVADRLDRLARSPTLATRLGEAGRRRYELDFAESVYQQRVLQLLHEVCVNAGMHNGCDRGYDAHE